MAPYLPSGALVFLDSFGAYTDVGDGNNTTNSWKWPRLQNPESIVASAGRGGRAAAWFGSTDGLTANAARKLQADFGDDPNNRLVCHGAFRFTTSSGWPASGGLLYSILSNNSIILTLQHNGAGGLAVYRNTTSSAQTLLSQTSGSVLQGADNYDFVEFRAFCAASPNGHYEVRVNGTTVLSETGIDTSSWDTFQPNPNSVVVGGRMQGSTNVLSSQKMYYADACILRATSDADAIFLGDNAIYHIMPNADGAHTAWTPTGGSHYTVVNETTDTNDDTAYVSTATAGAKDSYGFTDFPASMTWAALQVTVLARQESASPARQLKPFLRSGSTDSLHPTAHFLTTLYEAGAFGRWNTNPFTSGNWTSAALNACEIGVVLDDTETSPTARVTRIHAEALPGPSGVGAAKRWARSFG
jgi:hypothetical protein